MKNSSGLYIHIPFCIKKCAYCDFPSYSGCDEYFEKYIDALLFETRKYRGEKIDTVFIGGGTPTVLSETLLEKLLAGINESFDILPEAEFSAEANPGTVTEEKLAILKSGGVNRLSIGVQSFDNKELEILGRIHDSQTALETVEAAQRYFDNVNIDIMTAIPRQTEKSLMNTLKTAVATGVNHMSCYSLIVEEGTPFYSMYENGTLFLCSEDEDREMFETLCSYMKNQGFERYEISNFAKPGKRCRHNMKYWNTEDYIGIGAAAHSCVEGKRFYNTADLRKYIKQPGIPEEITELSLSDRMGEYVMMALRTIDGVSFEEFRRRFGRSFTEVYFSQLEKLKNTDLVRINEHSFALTEKGFDVSNGIMCEFV